MGTDFKKFSQAFRELYENGEVDIVWKRTGFRVSTTDNFDSYLDDIGFSGDLKHKYTKLLLRGVVFLATDRPPADQEDVELFAIISEVFSGCNDLFQEVLISTESNLNHLSEFGIEILTKRSKLRPSNILGYTYMLNMTITEPDNLRENSEVIKSVNLELSEKQIKSLITELTNMVNWVEESSIKGERDSALV